MLNKRTTRITIGAIFLIVLIISVIPSLYLHTSRDAIVNARTTTLKSPIEGVLHFSQPTGTGKFFKKGEVIGKVVNDRVNRSLLNELTTEKKTLESRISSLAERIEKYSALNTKLEKNLEKYQDFSAKQMRSMIKQTEYKLTQEKAEYERAKKEFDANKFLVDREAVKKRELERTESNYLKSSEKLMEIENRLEELKISLSAVENGAFLGDGHNDSPYSKQRMDQLVIEISLAKTALEEAKCRIEGIGGQIEMENARIHKCESFQLIAPFDSLVWRSPVTEGSTAVIGSELIVLLDCSSIFLDVAVSESQFANINAGEKIQYRLIGEASYNKGIVFAMRGSGSDLNDQNLAAVLSKDSKKEFHVWIRVEQEKLGLNPENFFQVGRRAEVKIPRKWNFFREIIRFVNVF